MRSTGTKTTLKNWVLHLNLRDEKGKVGLERGLMNLKHKPTTGKELKNRSKILPILW